jgi:hypothetical protein
VTYNVGSYRSHTASHPRRTEDGTSFAIALPLLNQRFSVLLVQRTPSRLLTSIGSTKRERPHLTPTIAASTPTASRVHRLQQQIHASVPNGLQDNLTPWLLLVYTAASKSQYVSKIAENDRSDQLTRYIK